MAVVASVIIMGSMFIGLWLTGPRTAQSFSD
jgi:hypothetical protein